MESGVATTSAATAEGLTPAPAPMCWATAAASSRPGGMGRVVGLDIAWSHRAGSAAVVGPAAAWAAASAAACVGDPTFAFMVEGAEPAGGDGGRAASVLAPDVALELAPSNNSRGWVRPGSPEGEEGTAGTGRPADGGGVVEPAVRPLCVDLGPDAVAWSACGGDAGLEGHGGTAAPDPAPAASEPQLQELEVTVASPGVCCSAGWWGTRWGVPDTVGLQGRGRGREGRGAPTPGWRPAPAAAVVGRLSGRGLGEGCTPRSLLRFHRSAHEVATDCRRSLRRPVFSTKETEELMTAHYHLGECEDKTSHRYPLPTMFGFTLTHPNLHRNIL